MDISDNDELHAMANEFCQLGADQDYAEDQKGCSRQPCQAHWVLREVEQAEMVEHQ